MRLGRAGALALAGLLASALGASPAAADVRVSEHQYQLGALDGWTEVPVAAASAVPGGVIPVAGYRHARTGALLAITRMALPNPRARDDDVCVVLKATSDEADEFVRDVAWEVGFENERVITTVILTIDGFENGPMSESTLVKNILREGITA